MHSFHKFNNCNTKKSVLTVDWHLELKKCLNNKALIIDNLASLSLSYF